MLPFLFSLLMSGWFMGFTASGVIIRSGRDPSSGIDSKQKTLTLA